VKRINKETKNILKEYNSVTIEQAQKVRETPNIKEKIIANFLFLEIEKIISYKIKQVIIAKRLEKMFKRKIIFLNGKINVHNLAVKTYKG
jgi:hypothetical protein